MMKQFFKYSLLCSFIVVFFACDKAKESSVRRKLSGPKKLSRYIWKKQDANGDFSKVIYDTTDMATLIIWDNDDPVANGVSYKGGVVPAGWGLANVGVKGMAVWWYADWEEGKTLTLWSQNSYEERFRTTYTLSHSLNYNKIVLQTIYFYNNEKYLEILELEDTE